MPAGRNLQPSRLVDQQDRAFSIRSARDGISYWSDYEGFVASNTMLVSRLARPRLRVLGMQTWIESIAAQSGFRAQLSPAGRTTRLISDRLGSRREAVEMICGPTHRMLRLFVDRRKDRPAGVTENDNRYFLRAEAVADALEATEPEDRRRLLDQYLDAGLIWQGFILDCDECASYSFIQIGKIDQRFECPKCGHLNSLGLARWRSKTFEPAWHYGMNPILSNFLASDGDIVLKTAARLMVRAQQRGGYFDASEIEFVATDTGETSFEIDLIAYVGGELIVTEVKKRPDLGGRKERNNAIRKRFLAARLLSADRVIFSSMGEWSDTTTRAVKSIQQQSFPEIEVEMMTLTPFDD